MVAVQNGVEHRLKVEPFAHGATVLPALAYTGVERVERGRLRHFAGHRLIVPAGRDGERFAALFEGSALDVELEPDFLTASWRKLLTNIPSNPDLGPDRGPHGRARRAVGPRAHARSA